MHGQVVYRVPRADVDVGFACGDPLCTCTFEKSRPPRNVNSGASSVKVATESESAVSRSFLASTQGRKGDNGECTVEILGFPPGIGDIL